MRKHGVSPDFLLFSLELERKQWVPCSFKCQKTFESQSSCFSALYIAQWKHLGTTWVYLWHPQILCSWKWPTMGWDISFTKCEFLNEFKCRVFSGFVPEWVLYRLLFRLLSDLSAKKLMNCSRWLYHSEWWSYFLTWQLRSYCHQKWHLSAKQKTCLSCSVSVITVV